MLFFYAVASTANACFMTELYKCLQTITNCSAIKKKMRRSVVILTFLNPYWVSARMTLLSKYHTKRSFIIFSINLQTQEASEIGLYNFQVLMSLYLSLRKIKPPPPSNLQAREKWSKCVCKGLVGIRSPLEANAAEKQKVLNPHQVQYSNTQTKLLVAHSE